MRGRWTFGTVVAHVGRLGLLLGAALAAVACHPPRAETLSRPEPTEERSLERVADPFVDGQALIDGFAPDRTLDPRQWPAATPQRMRPELPPRPIAMPLVRPRVRGDALLLADLAMHRGDAFDAAAQYRDLLARLTPGEAHYVRIQLGRAYLALGNTRDAEWLLAQAAASPEDNGAALFLLADVRLAAVGPVAAYRQLRAIAGRRIDDLENYIVHRAQPGDAAEILVAKVRRSPQADEACSYALAAIDRGGVLSTDGLGSGCALEIDRARAIVEGRLWLDWRNPSRRVMAGALRSWTAAWALVRDGGLDTQPWLDIAQMYAHAGEVALTLDDARVAHRATYLALLNVLRITIVAGPLGDNARARFDAVAATLPSDHQKQLAILRVRAVASVVR